MITWIIYHELWLYIVSVVSHQWITGVYMYVYIWLDRYIIALYIGIHFKFAGYYYLIIRKYSRCDSIIWYRSLATVTEALQIPYTVYRMVASWQVASSSSTLWTGRADRLRWRWGYPSNWWSRGWNWSCIEFNSILSIL